LLDGANHDFRPFKCSKNVFANIRFVKSVGRIIDFDDLANSESRNARAGDKSREISFGARDPDSDHGIDGDVPDFDGNHLVFDIIGVVGRVNLLEAGEVVGESLIREVFQDVLFVLDRFLSVDGSHEW
jgi:hypothetical protein